MVYQSEANSMTLQELELSVNSMTPDLRHLSKRPVVKNPFKSYLRISNLDKIKIIALCFLVPFRLILLVILFAVTIAWSTLFMIGYEETEQPQPHRGFRRIGVEGMFILSRIACIICGFHNVKVKGSVSPKTRMFVVAPHSSAIDIWLISYISRFTTVMRAENRYAPLVSNCFRIMQPIYISRELKKSKEYVAKEIKRRAGSEGWPPVLIFPEGTCTNRTSFVAFKPGAFYPGLPLQPVIIRYPDCVGDAMDYATWGYVGISVFLLFPLMLSRLHNRAEIEILPLYVPSQEEINNPVMYAKNVRDYVAKIDNVPTTDHSFEDCLLMDAAKGLNLPMEAGLVEYYKISPMIGMNFEGMVENLKKFAKIDQKCDGLIDIGEFCRYLNLPLTEEVETIFRIYDIDKDDVIDFREFLLGSFFVSKLYNSDENIQLAFSLFDTNNEGYITYNSFSNLFQSVLHTDEKYLQSIFGELDSERSGKARYNEFKMFCLKKPEYALLFIHFRALLERKIHL